MQVLQHHIDGKWWTSEYNYEGHKLQIKMREGHGAKIHIWNKEITKVIKTFRYSFVTKDYLLNRAIDWLKNNK